MAADPERTLIVIDPRRTETAALADIHLQVRPGTDAWLLSALVAIVGRRKSCSIGSSWPRTPPVWRPVVEAFRAVNVRGLRCPRRH